MRHKPLRLSYPRYLLITLLLGFALTAWPTPAVAAPLAVGSPAIVINEYYAPLGSDPAGQWIELMNKTATPILLNGWTLANANEEFALPATVITANSTLLLTFNRADLTRTSPNISGTAILELEPRGGALNPEADLLALITPGGLVADSIGWGTVDDNWKNRDYTRENLRAPMLTDRNKSVGRSSDGNDSDTASDFVVRNTATPGRRIRPPDPQLGRPTDFISVIGGVLLWIGFVLIALIARRFQNLSGQNTFWPALMVAPLGILIYTLVQANGFFARGALNDTERWTGFPILFVSAVLCIFVITVFSRIAGRYLEDRS